MAETPPDETRTIRVGETDYQIGRFRGFKAQEIMRRAAATARRYPEIANQVGEFERLYAESNALHLTRTEAEHRFGREAAEISEAAWESSGGVLPLKRMPGLQDRLVVMFAEVFEVAHRPVGELLALVSLTNGELRAADDADDVEGAIERRRKDLLHEGDLEELVELALVGYEVSRGQFGPLGDLVPRLLGLLTTDAPAPMASNTSPTTETPSSPSSEDSEPSSEPSRSGATSPSSSDDSPAPTDGVEERSSTASPGRPSEPALSG